MSAAFCGRSVSLKPRFGGQIWSIGGIGVAVLTQLEIGSSSPASGSVAGIHASLRQLEADIRAFIDRHNQNPKPFKWTKSADQILASVKRFCHKTQQTLCGEL